MGEIKELRERFQSMEGREKTLLLDRLSNLQTQVESLEEARRSLTLERDRAREELGSLRADWARAVEAKAGLESERTTMAGQLETSLKRVSEVENQLGKMTADRVSDQAMISKLLKLAEKADSEGIVRSPHLL
jgi:chromosome segregation ATPase